MPLQASGQAVPHFNPVYPRDRSLRLVYDFDKQVENPQRGGRIARPVEVRFLVYADVLNPPTRPLPVDFDYQTCVATFYPISRCYVHEFDDLKCSRNAIYQKQLFGWMADPQRHYRGQLVIGGYCNVSRGESLRWAGAPFVTLCDLRATS